MKAMKKMVVKANCAFLRADGYCPLLKGSCACENDRRACCLALRGCNPRKRAYSNLKFFDKRTLRGRQQFIVHEVGLRRLFSQCTGKTRYESQGEATRVMHRRVRQGSGPLRVYYCSFCGGYHLTHKARLVQERPSAA